MSRRPYFFDRRWLWQWFALLWCLCATSVAQSAVSGTLVQQGGTVTPAVGQAIPAGLALLSNGGKAVAYLNQTGGDGYYGVGPFYDGKVNVLDASNNPVTTVTVTAQASFLVSDMSVAALANGGFVVVWTERDQATSSTTFHNYFARYDNAGVLQGTAAAISATRKSLQTSVVGLQGGGFALLDVDNADHALYINAYSYSGGSFTAHPEVKWGDNSSAAPNPGNDPDIGRLSLYNGPMSATALSDGNFIVASPILDYVSSTYTPSGTFAMKFSPTGQPVNFAAGGVNYLRVNWDGNSQIAVAQAFNGGFAVMGMAGTDPNRKWEMTVFQNDGTLVTTNVQTAQVYRNGSTDNRTYNANQFANLTSTANPRYTWGSYYGVLGPIQLTTLGMQGGNVVAVLPNDANGFSFQQISTSTGLSVGSPTDLGITVPTPVGALASPNPGLLLPFYLPDGGSGSYALLYAVGGQQGGPEYYARSDVYQIGLDPIVPSSDATLSALGLSAGTLNPGFSSGTLSYTASVGYGAASISVTPTVHESHATVKVNGSVVASGVASGAIALNVGSNTVTVVVTAQDGTTVGTYTVTVTRAAPSANSDLSGLSLSSGVLAPAFVSGTTGYTASVSNATSAITVTPTVADANASIKVNGATVASGSASGSIALSVGSNTVTVAVTAQDGTTVSNYTVTVTRLGSSNANLAGLTLSAGTLSPAFAGGTTAYSASVSNGTTAIVVTPTLADANASVKVNGTTVASGSASGSIPLNVGSNTITVAVTAQDGSTVQTYTVTVTRIGASNADLSALALSTGTLSPAFSSATGTYTASVANTTTTITVTPTLADPNASVKVNGTSVASGAASGNISLNTGSNTITATVTAQDGTTVKTYTVTVTRAASSNADLSALVFSTGALSPVFASGTTNYTMSVPNATSSVTVTPTVADATASIKVNGTTVASGSASGSIALSLGSNTVTVAVTAQDGVAVKTYTITVTRADVAGLCGGSQGGATAFAPSVNLCTQGASSAVLRTGSNWSWSCVGGASTASCTAPLQDTPTNAGVGSAAVIPNGNNWVVDTQNSSGFIPVTGHPKSPVMAPPTGYRFPYGLFDVKLIAGTPNSQASVVITYPQNLPTGAVYWKYGPRVLNGPSDWYVFSGAVIAGNTVTLTLTDQGAGDSDLGTPSSIVDPGGVGAPLDASQIPTLSEWAFAIVSALLVLGGALTLRRTQRYRR